MADDMMEIGIITNTHGLKGEVKVTPWCDDPAVFESVGTVFADGVRVAVQGVKHHKNSVILKLSSADSIDEAEKLRGVILCTTREQLGELPPMTYYIKDLIGLSVFEGERLLGRLEDCFPTGGNDVYAVRRDDGRQLLIPAIKQVVKRVDIVGGRMDVELLEGLADED